MHQLKGEVTITKRDVETLEIISEETYNNIITELGYNAQGATGGGDVGILSAGDRFHGQWDTNPVYYYTTVGISEMMVAPNIRTMTCRADSTFNHIGYNLHLNYQYIPPAGANLGYFETQFRFNPPSTGTRNIRTIYTYKGGSVRIRSYVSLTTPCTQTTSQYLDVTYRIFGAPAVTVPINEFFKAKDADLAFEQSVLGGFNGDKIPLWLTNALVVSPGPTDKYYIGTANYFEGLDLFEYNRDFWRRRWFISYNQDQYIGRIFRSFAIAAREGTTTGHGTPIRVSATPSNFPHKPIQPIHNHSVNAVEPFLDIDFLATGNGYIQVDGSGYTKTDDLPMWYRVDIRNTGVIGTSRYYFAKRYFVGWGGTGSGGINSSNYNNGGSTSVSGMIPWIHGKPATETRQTFGAGECDSSENWAVIAEEYDGKKYLTHSSTQIVLVDFITGDFKVFNSTTLPGLNISSIYQIAVDNNYDIWIACKDSGLWKIQSPENTTPTVIHYTQALHGIPADGGCYGVCEGYNNSIWAMFNDGLARTDNYGTTWTIYNSTTTPAFTYTSNGGITNGNWSNVRMIRADVESSTHRVGILHIDPANLTNARGYIAWWTSGGSGTSYPGPSHYKMLLSDAGRPKTNYFRCSRVGNVWISAEETTTACSYCQNIFRETFGSTAWLFAGVPSGYTYTKYYNGCMFFYDQYNRPYYLGHSGREWPETFVVNEDNIAYNRHTWGYSPSTSTGVSGHIMFAPEKSAEKGWFVRRKETVDSSHTGLRNYPAFDFLQLYNVNVDPWNHEHSPHSEFVWSIYRWNGSSWVKNYNQNATDSSSYNRPAERKGFDTEDHYFTGRSRLLPPVSVLTGNFTSAFTFAATITPAAKKNTQEKNAILLDIRDTTDTGKITLYWKRDNSGNKISIQKSDNTFTDLGTTSTDDNTYRVVLTVNGTTAKLYINGVQFGSNVTLPSTLDLSNGSGNTRTSIGAHLFKSTAFFRGTIRNAQLWNVEWNTTDIANDMVNIYGVISSQPSTALHCHYQLNEAIIETKPTHTGHEPFTDGLQLKFNAGAEAPDFVHKDYYTFAAVDGIVKDNATSFSYQYDLFLKPATHDYSDVEDTINAPGNMTPVINASGGQITEKGLFRSVWANYGCGGTQYNYSYFLCVPGQVGVYDNGPDNSYSCCWTALSFQHITGDGYFEFKIGSKQYSGDSPIGFSNSSDLNNGSSTTPYYFYFNYTGSFTINQGTGSALYTGTYVVTDKFKIQRTGTTITFYKNDILIYTSGTASTGTLIPKIQSNRHSLSLYDININYTRPGYFLDMGNSVAQTGKYDPDFLVFAGDSPTYEVKINGVNAAVTVLTDKNTFLNTIATPNAGEVIIEPFTGLIKCSSADVGKTVSIKCTLITDK